MFGSIFAQAFLNVDGISCAFEIYTAEAERAVDKMDVTIDETREDQLSACVDHFCAYAAHALDYRVVTDSYDLAVMNRHGLGPWLLGILGVNAAVNDYDIRRFGEPALRARHQGSAEQHRD